MLLVARGEWAGHPVRRAMVLGVGYVLVPWNPTKEQWLYLPMTEYLAAWSRTQPPERVPVTIVGRHHDERSHALRDLLTRATVPFRFVEADTEEGREELGRMGLDASRLPAVHHFSGATAADPSAQKMAELLGFRRPEPGMACDVAIVGGDRRGSRRRSTPRPRDYPLWSSTRACRADRPAPAHGSAIIWAFREV